MGWRKGGGEVKALKERRGDERSGWEEGMRRRESR